MYIGVRTIPGQYLTFRPAKTKNQMVSQKDTTITVYYCLLL